MEERNKKEPPYGARNRICSSKVVKVLQVVEQVGTGEEHDPVSDVVSFWTPDGRFIGEWTVRAITDCL